MAGANSTDGIPWLCIRGLNLSRQQDAEVSALAAMLIWSSDLAGLS